MEIQENNSEIIHIKPIEIVSDLKRIRILLDETRIEILKVMKGGIFRNGKRVFDMSVSEISDRLGSSPQRIYHHVDKLVEGGFLIKAREEKKVRSITSYYMRTAHGFVISYNSDNPPTEIQQRNKEWVMNIDKAFGLSLNDKDLNSLVDLTYKLNEKGGILFDKLASLLKIEIEPSKMMQMLGFLRTVVMHSDPEVNKIMDDISTILVPLLNYDKTI